MRIVAKIFCLLTWCFLSSAAGQDAHSLPLNDRVLVVYNSWTKQSKQVADHYISKRNIPAANLCALKIDDADSQNYQIVARADVEKKVMEPIKKCLEKVGRQRILYIVLTYQTPFLINHQTKGYGIAIDQFIAEIWSDWSDGREPNPYNQLVTGRTVPRYTPFADFRDKPDAPLIYSVWRLDGKNEQAAIALVDKALEAESSGLKGQVCIDRRHGDNWTLIPEIGYGIGEWSLHRAADASRQAGFNVVEDSNDEEFGTAPAPLRCDNTSLYAGWYSLKHYNDAFTWNVGAIGIHLDSSSAENPRMGDSWVANALAKGITVTAGAVNEPYLQGLPSPDVIFSAVYEGANVGDAFLR